MIDKNILFKTLNINGTLFYDPITNKNYYKEFIVDLVTWKNMVQLVITDVNANEHIGLVDPNTDAIINRLKKLYKIYGKNK